METKSVEVDKKVIVRVMVVENPQDLMELFHETAKRLSPDRDICIQEFRCKLGSYAGLGRHLDEVSVSFVSYPRSNNHGN